MNQKKVLKELIRLYKTTVTITDNVEKSLGTSKVLEGLCDDITRSIRKVLGMPIEDLKLTDDYCKDDFITCWDAFGDMIFDYGIGDGELEIDEIIEKLLSWDSHIKNYKIFEEGNLYCSEEKPQITRWGDETHIFAICPDCNEGYVIEIILDEEMRDEE